MNDLLSRLIDARKSLRFSQVKLAGLSGVSLPTIQNIEAGKANPSLEILERLAKPLGLLIRIEPRPANWDLLAACGIPLTAKKISHFQPTPPLFSAELKAACLELLKEEGDDFLRKEKAIQVTLWTLATRYPKFYARELGNIPAVQAVFPQKITGPFLKLRRIIMEALCQYL